jgi:phosphoserine/homoserine phosphotransferase
MLSEADAGVLFRPPDKLVGEYPHFPVTQSHEELYETIMGALA